MTPFDSPRLIADVGGTTLRLALEGAAGELSHLATLRHAEHADLPAAIKAYCATLPAATIRHAGIAVANPVEGDQVHMIRQGWQFSIEALRQQLELDTLIVVNDFTALAMALPRLQPQDLRQVGGGEARPQGVVGLLGPGSGLGVSGLMPAPGGWLSLGSEGGHASFSPRDEAELTVLRHAWRQFEHVSYERLLSGPGLELIHAALAAAAGSPGPPLTAPEITRRAIDQAAPDCAAALDLFCAVLGSAASDLAVTLGAIGGIYVGGGIVPRLGDWFDRSRFRARFEDKGRLSRYVAAIPTYVVTAENPTLIGVAAILDAQLRTLGSPESALLEQVKRARGTLSKAAMRVADHVLAHPRAVLGDPIAEIARAAQVSQPTVIRFCRSLGCEGLSDFKLRLASGLTGSGPVTHSLVTHDDSAIEIGAKVLGNTASAILTLRGQMNREMVDRALGLLLAARRVEFHAVGHYGAVAQDAQFKFLRLGLPSNAHTDPRLQLLAAAVLGPGDVAVIISSGGRVPELLQVAEVAQQRGAAVLAITASQSVLARKADVALIVDHVEHVSTHLPMVSRILHLLIIDILAVGVAMRRHPGGLAALPADVLAAVEDPASRARLAARPGPGAPAPGISIAAPLAGLTSHSR